MTLHVAYNHQCPNCAAAYIPYDHAVPCPKCGLVEKDRFDYVRYAAESMAFNHQHGGHYMPPAWFSGSLGDQVLYVMFALFDSYVASSDSAPFKDYARDWLANMNFGEYDYARDHVLGIALRLFSHLSVSLH